MLSRLPADVLPQIQHCQFDQTAMYKPHFDENGLLKVAGTACTTKYTPDPKDPVNAEYLRRWLYPEVLVRNTIQRYWQQGMIGSQNLTGPDADLGARFLNGQAVNLKLPDLTKIQQNAPAGAVWCTYQDNQQVCGRSDKPGPPGNVVAATEAEYRSAIQDAGDAIYPYIQGRAGNRTAAGFSALAASAAAAPFPAAAYTAVLTARLLLRLGLIAGLFVGIGMMVRPHLARRVLNVIAGSLLVVLLFSAAGALMTYLSMVMLSPTTVAGYPARPDRRGDHPRPGVADRVAADPPDQTHHRHVVLRRHRQPAPAVRAAAPGDGRPAPAHSTAPLAPRPQSPGQRPAGEPDRSGHADRTGPAEPPRTGHHRPTPHHHPAAGPARAPARHPRRRPASRRPRPSRGSHRPPPSARHRRVGRPSAG